MRRPLNPWREFSLAAAGNFFTFTLVASPFVVSSFRQVNLYTILFLAFLVSFAFCILYFAPIYTSWLVFRLRNQWPPPRQPPLKYSLAAGIIYPVGLLIPLFLPHPQLEAISIVILALVIFGSPLAVAECVYRLIRWCSDDA